jgi:hypothetical protein
MDWATWAEAIEEAMEKESMYIARGAVAARQSEALKRHTDSLIAAMDDDALLARYITAERTHDKDRVQRIQYGCLVRAVRERIPAQRVLAALNEAESKEGEA